MATADTPHIKRFEEYGLIPQVGMQYSPEALFRQFAVAHDDLAEHVERLAAIADLHTKSLKVVADVLPLAKENWTNPSPKDND